MILICQYHNKMHRIYSNQNANGMDVYKMTAWCYIIYMPTLIIIQIHNPLLSCNPLYLKYTHFFFFERLGVHINLPFDLLVENVVQQEVGEEEEPQQAQGEDELLLH